MPNINITVAEKIATNTTPGVVIVCGNSDYTVAFDFDEEWAAETERVARFLYYKDGLSRFQDVAFTGNTAAVPVLSGVDYVLVGVYAGNLHTTTPAKVLCDRSILCGNPLEDLSPAAVKNLQKQIDDLAKSGGGGMGGADWNAAEGEPGHVLNRTHWVEYGERVQLLPETTFTFAEDGEMTNDPASITVLNQPTVGGTYTVNWKGIPYECVGHSYEMEGTFIGVILGNQGYLGGTDTGEPFEMVFVDSSMIAALGAPFVAFAADGSTEAAISVSGAIETVHKLDPKFLPDEVVSAPKVYNVHFDLTMSGSVTVTTEQSFTEVYFKALDPNTIVRGIAGSAATGGLFIFFNLAMVSNEALVFSSVETSNSMMNSYNIVMRSDGICEWHTKQV